MASQLLPLKQHLRKIFGTKNSWQPGKEYNVVVFGPGFAKGDLLWELCFNELLKQNLPDRLYESSLCLLWVIGIFRPARGAGGEGVGLKRTCLLWAMFRSKKNIICLLSLLIEIYDVCSQAFNIEVVF